jgi:hypothetical protein
MGGVSRAVFGAGEGCEADPAVSAVVVLAGGVVVGAGAGGEVRAAAAVNDGLSARRPLDPADDSARGHPHRLAEPNQHVDGGGFLVQFKKANILARHPGLER